MTRPDRNCEKIIYFLSENWRTSFLITRFLVIIILVTAVAVNIELEKKDFSFVISMWSVHVLRSRVRTYACRQVISCIFVVMYCVVLFVTLVCSLALPGCSPSRSLVP